MRYSRFRVLPPAHPTPMPEYADDIEVTIDQLCALARSGPNPVPPPAAARYMPDRHRLTSRKLDLDLTGEPLVPAPAHGLPLEYMEGPYRYRGTLRGEPVSGFAFYERSLALYRDWELVDVLAAAEPGERDEVARLIDELSADRVRPCLVTVLQPGLVAAEHQVFPHTGREVGL